MATPEEMAALAGQTVGGAQVADIDALASLAGQITAESRSYEDRLIGSMDYIRELVGEGNIAHVVTPNHGLQRIEIQAPAGKEDEVSTTLGNLFGKEAISRDLQTNLITVFGGSELGKRRLSKATGVLDAAIRDQATGTIGGVKRLGAKTKLTPEGTQSYLEEVFGQGSVWPVSGDPGNFYVKSGGQWRWLDQPKKTELLDVVDVIPEMGEAALGIGGTVVGARMAPGAPHVGAAVGGAAGDLLASVARQAVSGALPGEDFPRQEGIEEAAERAKIVAFNVGAGLAGEGVQAAGRALSPARAVSRKVGREVVAETPEDFLAGGGRRARQIAKERNEMGKRRGVDLSLGEATGSATILRLEGLLSDMPVVADIQHRFRAKRVNQLAKSVERVVKSTSGGAVGAFRAGQAVESSYRALADNMMAERKAVAEELYRRAHDAAGGQPIIDMAQTTALVRQIAEESNIPLRPSGTGSAAASLVGQLQQGGLGMVDVETFQRMRSLWGRASRGQATVFEGLSPRENATIAKRVYGAINGDMEATIAKSEAKPFVGPGGEMTTTPAPMADALNKLKDANAVYRAMSERMGATQNVILEKATKLADIEGQEKLLPFITSRATTEKQVASAVAILGAHNPAAVRELRGAVLEDILGKAQAKGGATFDISPAELAKQLRLNDGKLRHLFKNDMQGYQAIREIQRLGDIVRDAPFQAGSKTGGMILFAGALKAFAQAGWNPRQFMSQAALLLTAKRMARMVNDPTKAAEFLRIVKPKPGPAARTVQQTLRATTRLIGSLEREEALEESSP